MSLTWAVELPASAIAGAQSLRLVPGVEAKRSDDEDALWLRGRDLNPLTMRLVRRLPCRRRFRLLEDGRAVPEGSAVPVMKLLGSGWVPLRHFEAIEPPPVRRTGASASPPPQAFLGLAPAAEDTVDVAPDLLLVPFEEWRRYAVSAPAVRLAPLRFAVSEDGRTAVHGEPLPPLLGTFYTVRSGLAVPVGRTLEPALSFVMLARHFNLDKGDILLFHADGTCEFLGGSDFAAASRSAVRSTVPLPEPEVAP